MGEALYLEDGYMRECDAKITSVTGKEVVLDRTVFYPRGGGQPCDTGAIISASGARYRVVNVYKKEGDIMHELAPEAEGGRMALAPGESVHCVLDWERRYKLMRMHTAAHVLAAVMHRELGVLITGNQLEEDKSRFDFSIPEFDRVKFEIVVEKANAALSGGVELKAYSLPRADALKIPGVVKLANALPPAITTLRIVEIPGIDIQADAGTHVRSLKEVGKITISKLENKGKDNRRIYFTLS
ncbi:MAG: alanyl-tRNA editing protein AlaXM [Candidatus Micrarchaeota archaeon]